MKHSKEEAPGQYYRSAKCLYDSYVPCRTLKDFSKEEIRDLESRYGTRVVHPIRDLSGKKLWKLRVQRLEERKARYHANQFSS